MKTKVVRDHPLINLEGGQGRAAGAFGAGNAALMIDTQQYEQEQQYAAGEDDYEDGGITSKLKAIDPLADFADMENPSNQDFETWEAKKLTIFSMFKEITDSQDIVLDDGKGKGNVTRPMRMGQGKSRLDQLEQQAKAGGAQQTISAKEFTSQLERLDKEMTKAWTREDKVSCIRIAIQCAKLLNDVASPLFYPQKFILLTDILDNFGELVRGRMRKLTKEHSKGRLVITDENEDQVDFSQIPDKVQEISRNWFIKCACIREVLPRIYLELALVSVNKYMQMKVQQSDLVRLAKMIRGIAEPLCAAWTCAYLARVGHAINPNAKDYLLLLVEYMFKLYNLVVERGHHSLDTAQYRSLFDPTVDWLIQCLAYQADRQVFKDVWAVYSNHPKYPIFLKSIVKHFPSEIVSVAVTILIMSVKDDYKDQVDDQLALVKELGLALLRCPPKKNQFKLDFINFGWERMGQTQNPDRYMDCSIVLIEFSIKSLNQGSV